MWLHHFAVLCVLLVESSCAKNIPDYIHVCKRSDPDLAKCIRESVEALRPRLKAGIPEIDVPSLEPLNIKEIAIFRGERNLKAYLRNIKVHGAGDFKVTKLKVDNDENTYRVGIKFPKLVLEGDYDVDARILVVPIKGAGRFSAEVVEPEGQGVIKGQVINRDGYKQLVFTSFDFALKVKDYDIHLENLFGGDEVLRQAVRDIFRENKQELMNSALPFIQRKVAELLMESANKITNNLDYDEVFPEK